MKDHWTWFPSDIVAFDSFWHETHYLFSDIDAVTATFHVLVNTYFLNFRLALLIVLRALVYLIYLVIFSKFLVFNFAVANVPVPVTADMNIKVPVNLKLQPRRHTDTLIFTSIHLMDLMIHFLCRKLKKITISEIFFQIWHLFIFYRYCNYKQIRWRYTGSALLELKVPVFKTVLKLQSNSLTVYR